MNEHSSVILNNKNGKYLKIKLEINRDSFLNSDEFYSLLVILNFSLNI
jgi:hypothetical protein